MPRPAQAGRDAAGRAVRAWRADRTQQDVAEQAGIDIDTLSALENGTRWPWNRTLRAVEDALGRPRGELDRIAAEVDAHDRSPPSLLDERIGREDAELVRQALREEFPDQADAILAGIEDRLKRQRAGGR